MWRIGLSRGKQETTTQAVVPAEPELDPLDQYFATKGFTSTDLGSYFGDLAEIYSGGGGWQGVYQFQSDYFQRLTDTLHHKDGSYSKIAKLVLGNPIANSCLRLIAESISSLNFKMIRETQDGKLIEANDHPILKLLRQPGLYDVPGTMRTQLSLWERMTHHFHFAGEVFVLLGNERTEKELIRMERGYMNLRESKRHRPGTFTILHPRWFRNFIRDPHERIVGYEFGVRQNNKISTLRVTANQVLHIKRYNCDCEDRGLPLAYGAYKSLVQSDMATTWNTNLSKTGGRSPGYFYPQGMKPGKQLSTEQVEAIEKYLDERLRTRQDQNLPMVMSGAMEYVENKITPREADFMENDKLNQRKIASAMKVPSILAGDVDSQGLGGGSGTKHAEKLLWRNCLLPIVHDFVQEINYNLVPRFGDRYLMVLDVEGIEALEEDLDKKWQRIHRAVGGPWLVPNEARRLTGWELRDGQPDPETGLSVFEMLGTKKTAKNERDDSRSDYERDNESENVNER